MPENNMALWGWDSDAEVWVKLAVTGAGALVIDMAGISLNDIGNVNAPAPADGDALVWDDATSLWIPVAMPAAGAAISSGQYTGNNTVNRAIPHGLGLTPKIVFIHRSDLGYGFNRITDQSATIYFVSHLSAILYAVTAMTATNFYVGNATRYDYSANKTGHVYDWVAIGQ